MQLPSLNLRPTARRELIALDEFGEEPRSNNAGRLHESRRPPGALHRQPLRACLTRLFGWRAEQVAVGNCSYLTLGLGNGINGGVVEYDRERSLWLPYVEVADVSDVTERARSLGGTVVLEPREGLAGWRSVVSVPAGAEIALWQPKVTTAPPEDRSAPRAPAGGRYRTAAAGACEDVRDVLLDGADGQRERLGDARVGAALGHQPEHLELARCQALERAVRAAAGEELRDDLRIERGAALGDPADGVDELVHVHHAVLQQVADAAPSVREKLGRVLLLDVLRDDQDRRFGSAAAHSSAARTPSSRKLGGRRMSTIAMSGCSRGTSGPGRRRH